MPEPMMTDTKRRMGRPQKSAEGGRVTSGYSLPPEVVEKLRKTAKEQGVTISHVIEEALQMLFKTRENKVI